MIEYPGTWRAEWLRLRGLHDWARYLEGYTVGELERVSFGCHSDEREARALGMV